MDAKTRHELKTNEFGEFLSRFSTNDKQLWIWVGVIVGVILIWAGYRWFQSADATGKQRAWAEMIAIAPTEQGGLAGVVAQLREAVARADSPALLAATRLKLARALIDLSQSEEAQRDRALNEAAEVLKQATASPGAPFQFVAASKFLLATVEESRGQVDAARTQYKDLIDGTSYAGSPFKQMAVGRLNSLADLSTTVQFTPGNAPPPATQPAADASAAQPVAPETPPADAAAQPAPQTP